MVFLSKLVLVDFTCSSSYLKDIMKERKVIGSFASGGITSYFVDLLNEGYFEKLYDVQCFDLDAVKSYNDNLIILKCQHQNMLILMMIQLLIN